MEKLESINSTLIDLFGIDTVTGKPMFQVVWAPDQVEKRMSKFTENGIEMLEPKVLELKKYPWMGDFYVLERLVIIPEINIRDLPATKLSYEPLWVFRTQEGQPLPPNSQVCKFVIDTMYAAMGKESLAKYVKNPDDPNAPINSKEELNEHRKKTVDELHNAMFGDESGLNQATFTGQGIIVPPNYKKESQQ